MQFTSLADRILNKSTDDVMGGAEGDALAREVVRDISGEGIASDRRLTHTFRVDTNGREHAREQVQRRAQGIERVEETLLVLLEVLVVGERQRLEDGEQRDKVAVDAAGLATPELCD